MFRLLILIISLSGCDMSGTKTSENSEVCNTFEVARFDGKNGDYVEFGVGGYQFPDIIWERWDSNWLIIVGSASLNGQTWNFCDPALTTFELKELKSYFENLAKGSARHGAMGFTEPNFEFEYVEDNTLRVFFELEVRPDWSKSNIAGKGDLYVDVSASREQLLAASSQLDKILVAFPERGKN